MRPKQLWNEIQRNRQLVAVIHGSPLVTAMLCSTEVDTPLSETQMTDTSNLDVVVNKLYVDIGSNTYQDYYPLGRSVHQP